MSLPGAPTVYYGDEVGLTGGDDPYNRMPYPWADLGGQPDMALRADFKALLQLRKDQTVMRRGVLSAPLASTASSAVLTRHWGKDTALIAFNNSMETQTHTFKTPTALKGQQGRMWWGAGKVQVEGQNMTVTIQPLSGWIWGASSQAK
jgi:glycosidase